MHFVVHLLLLTGAILLVGWIMPTVHIRNSTTAFVVAVVYSLVNILIGWLLVLLSLPFLILTLGLFKLVLNAIMLWITDLFVNDFKIDGVRSIFIAAVLITLFSTFFGWII